MNFAPTSIPDVLIVEPKRFGDARGFFMETWHAEKFRAAGVPARFVQENVSRSRRGTLRGLHYQLEHPQGKLMRVTEGSIFDVAVDIRRGSPTFGQWVGSGLSAENGLELWVPPGFAHGFCVTSASADVSYLCTDIYHAPSECTIRWDDADLAIDWPVAAIGAPILSQRDRAGVAFRDAECFEYRAAPATASRR